jgi:hypothetical protein
MIRYWGSSAPPTKKLKLSKPTSSPSSLSANSTESLDYVTIRENRELEELLKFLLFDRQCSVEIWSMIDSKWQLSNKVELINTLIHINIHYFQGISWKC